MTSPTLVTVEAYRVDDLTDAARDRLVERERTTAWETWVTDEVTYMLRDLVAERVDGLDELDVTAWSLDYYPGGVVEGQVVDGPAFARSLGVDEDRPLRLDPHHGQGVWPGTTFVDVDVDGDGYGWSRHDDLSRALGLVIDEVLSIASVWADDVTSDEAILEGLRAGAWWYDRTGDPLIDVAEVTP